MLCKVDASELFFETSDENSSPILLITYRVMNVYHFFKMILLRVYFWRWEAHH